MLFAILFKYFKSRRKQMKTKSVQLKRDGTYVNGDFFDFSDLPFFVEIFNDWLDINQKLKKLGGRSMNVPDVFSEAIYGIYFNAIRTNGKAYSYDCVDVVTGEGIQIKSSSIPEDLSSFGPRSSWDRLIFADYCSNGVVDGIVKFYEIDDSIYSLILNQKKGQTFSDQQKIGLRPRLSIKKSIIIPNGIAPILVVNLLEGK